MLLFVYGTLKKGKYNHTRFGFDKLSEFVGNKTLDNFTLKVPKGFPYPFCVRKEGSKVNGELYKITDKDLIRNLDAMEIGAGYTRVQVDGTDINLYILENSKQLDHLPNLEEF